LQQIKGNELSVSNGINQADCETRKATTAIQESISALSQQLSESGSSLFLTNASMLNMLIPRDQALSERNFFDGLQLQAQFRTIQLRGKGVIRSQAGGF
jgi:hypothetical protein